MRTTPPRHQRGVALITAILLVAIATVLAAQIAWDNKLNMRRTESALNQEQARLFALGAEAVAIDQLIQHRIDYAYDFLPVSEQSVPNIYTFGPITLPLELEGEVVGQMSGEIRDAQNKLNLNNLVRAADGQPNQDAIDGFKNLLNQPQFRDLRIDGTLADAIVDWIDNDTVPQGAGAEDGSYTSLDPPYRPANNYLTDISELRAIVGISKEAYEALLPFVTAIPPGWCGTAGTGFMPTNVNLVTTPEVLAGLLNVSMSEAQNLLAARDPDEGWPDIAEFQRDITDPNIAANAQTIATVQSSCSELRVTVIIGSSTLTMYSLLDRLQTGQIVTRVRAFGLD